MTDSRRPDETAAWQALAAHYQQIKDVHLRQLFAEDRGRGERLTVEGAGLYLDYSKNRITDETLRLLMQLAQERGVSERRDAMFRGDKVNVTEQRAVLHVALRAPRTSESWSTAATSCPMSIRCWTPCRTSLRAFARARGSAILASASAMS